MAGCSCENWTLQDLSSALQDMHKDNKKIVVPMFQRGQRWNKKQEKDFIDSLIKGYPVGTMLFYETFEDGKKTYILVDGLQRGNSIKKYMTKPTDFFYDENISDDFCAEILVAIGEKKEKNFSDIRAILTNFIKEEKGFKNVQYYFVAKKITEYFNSDEAVIGNLINIIKDFFEERQNLYDTIAGTVIPVIVYSGEESNLPIIFDRINSKGTPLDQYEIYAAAWPVNEKYEIDNTDIIEHIVKKYDSFTNDGFIIHGYSREEMRALKTVNAFEYLFGLGKHLVEKYEILGFNKNISDDTVNPIAFELVNACLNDTDKIRILYKNLRAININNMEKALYNAIDFVNQSISVITKFKGNTRNTKKIFHSKYQILSMISTTFKEMYIGTDYLHLSETWDARKDAIAKNLVQYYVYDIITNYWSEGGTGKIHAAAKPNRYMSELSSRAWMVALDSFFERSMLRVETKKIASPKSEELVILNCIYVSTFTAMDQLSVDRFDVEHIAPKEQMKKLIGKCNGEGLPVSCIANLCYLPEYINRSKKEKNFYQDKKYLQTVELAEIESKYSFTVEDDLEWMDIPYDKPEDFPVLKEYYTEFCTKRFDKIKHLFCDSLGIEYQDVNYDKELEQKLIIPKSENVQATNSIGKQINLTGKCAMRLADLINTELIKMGRSTYKSKDNSRGYVISTSKMYVQGTRKKYWFAYRRRPLEELKECTEIFIVYGCKDENTMLIFPVSEIEKSLDALNVSGEGASEHWHIVFFKENDGTMSWLLSKPFLREVDISKYII